MSKEQTPIEKFISLKLNTSDITLALELKKFVDQNYLSKEETQAKVEELQKENKHLKQVYEHRCNEVKDKVETIHNYFNQITKLQKGIDKAYEALNDIVWLIERGASMDEVIESVNAKARPFLLKK